jgi:hypothetical protein
MALQKLVKRLEIPPLDIRLPSQHKQRNRHDGKAVN